MEAAVVEALGHEVDEVRRRAEVLIQDGCRRRSDGDVEEAVPAHVEPADQQGVADPVYLGRQLQLLVGQEGDVAQLVGVTNDDGPAGPKEGRRSQR